MYASHRGSVQNSQHAHLPHGAALPRQRNLGNQPPLVKQWSFSMHTWYACWHFVCRNLAPAEFLVGCSPAAFQAELHHWCQSWTLKLQLEPLQPPARSNYHTFYLQHGQLDRTTARGRSASAKGRVASASTTPRFGVWDPCENPGLQPDDWKNAQLYNGNAVKEHVIASQQNPIIATELHGYSSLGPSPKAVV